MDFEGMDKDEVATMVKSLLVFAASKLRGRWFRRGKPDPGEYVSDAMILVERGRLGYSGKGARQRNRIAYPRLEDQLRSIIDSLISDEVRGADNRSTNLLDDKVMVADRRSNPEELVGAKEKLSLFFEKLTELAFEAEDNGLLLKVIELLDDDHTMDQGDWVERLGIAQSAANNLKKRLKRLMNKTKEALDADQ
jgi:hypothetical protein